MSASDPNRLGRQLPPIDPAAADALWQHYLTAADVKDGVTYTDVFHFGDHPELVDELLGLVLDGRKRATASGLAELDYDADIDVVFERFDIVYPPSP